MKRQRVLSALVRMLTAWALLMVQGVCDTAHFAAFAFVPTAPVAVCAAPQTSLKEQEARHAQQCHCRTCRGPKHCCCDTATTETERIAFRAVCDTPDEKGIPGVVGPLRALPTTPITCSHFWQAAIPSRPTFSLHGFQATPLEPATPPPTV